MSYPLEIKVSGTMVSAGMHSCDTPVFFHTTTKAKLNNAKYFVDITDMPFRQPERNKWFSDNLGSKFFIAWNRCMWSVWVKPYEELVNFLARGTRGRYNPEKIMLIHSNANEMNYALKNGQNNITPFLMLGFTIKELREIFGNDLWNDLCKNTKSRNLLIFNILSRGDDYERLKFSLSEGNKKDVNFLKCLDKIPSSWLNWRFRFHVDSLDLLILSGPLVKYCREERIITKISTQELRVLTKMYLDVSVMAKRFGKDFELDAIPAKIKKFHDEYVVFEHITNRFNGVPIIHNKNS